MGMDLGMRSKTQLDYFVGFGIEHRPEVGEVKRALAKIDIALDDFKIRVVGVYATPRPIGFDFHCDDSSGLLAKAQSLANLAPKAGGPFDFAKQADPVLLLDDPKTLPGKFMSLMAKGHSFRQPGQGRVLHLIIALNGWCNAHLDTHGLVVGNNGRRAIYDFNCMLQHGYWDLAGDLASSAFGAFGKKGMVGPMVEPMKGLDGHTRIMIGIKGKW